MSEKSFYDRRWDADSHAGVLAMRRAAVLLSEISELNLKSPTMIDLGCGSGWFTAILAQFGSVVGVDQTVETARRRYPWLTFVEGDVRNKSASLDPVDLVVCQEVLEHLENQSLLVEWAMALLKPGGYLVLTTPNSKVTFRTTSPEWRKQWLNQPVENHLEPRALRLLIGHYAEIVRHYTFIGGVGRQGIFRLLHSPRFPFLAKLTLRFGYGLHTIVVARRR